MENIYCQQDHRHFPSLLPMDNMSCLSTFYPATKLANSSAL